MFVCLTDGLFKERHCALPALQQTGVSAGGDGRNAEAQGHQSQRQQVRSLVPHTWPSSTQFKIKPAAYARKYS